MTTQEIANKLVASSALKASSAEYRGTLYSDDIVSMEAGAPPGGSREAKGIAAIRGKGEWWATSHEIHGCTVQGPL